MYLHRDAFDQYARYDKPRFSTINEEVEFSNINISGVGVQYVYTTEPNSHGDYMANAYVCGTLIEAIASDISELRNHLAYRVLQHLLRCGKVTIEGTLKWNF